MQLRLQFLLVHPPIATIKQPSRSQTTKLTHAHHSLILNPNPINDSYGWHLQYLTIIGLTLATLTFTSALLSDLTLSPHIFLLKNALSVASAPMELLISLLYWGLRLINPALVLPDWAPPLALSADLSFHAAPALLLTTDLLFFSPPYTIAFLPSMGLSACIAFGYWFWIEQCYQQNGFYPYPIFEMLGQAERVGLFAFAAVVMAGSTWTLKWLYRRVNGEGMTEGMGGEGRRREADVPGGKKGN